MEIKQLELTDILELDLLPPRAAYIAKSDDAIIVGAYIDNNLTALTVLKQYKEDVCVIHFLRVYDNNKETLKEFVLAIEDEIKRDGCNKIACKLVSDIDTQLFNYDVLSGLGYYAASVNGRFVLYFFDDIVDTFFYEKINDMDELISRVKDYDQLSPVLKAEAAHFINKNDYAHDNPDYSTVLGRFYIVKDRIEGFLDVRRLAYDMLYINDAYIKDSKNEYVMPSLLASLIQVAMQTMPESATLVLPDKMKHIYYGMETCFGKADTDYRVFEYVRHLD